MMGLMSKADQPLTGYEEAFWKAQLVFPDKYLYQR